MKWRVAISAFNPSKCTQRAVNTHTHTHREHTPGAVGSHIAAAPGEQLGIWFLLKGLTSVMALKGEESAGYSLQNQNGLIMKTVYVFGGLKKRSEFFSIVGWLCPHIAKTHLYANEVILHPMPLLKWNYYNLNSSDGFRKSDSNQCWVLL